jgi:hypothetical protein
MANRLQYETSPYLQQHAGNPVDWYPWGAEAFERARREDRPILLSIGYSTCHWCHVMAHESFDDPGVAGYMNEHFVCIKVDREERPDLDQIYQAAYQLLARRSGGWPLTMFLAPDQIPFFGATYLPRIPQHGITGFVDVMDRVLLAWRERRADIDAQNGVILEAIRRTDRLAGIAAPPLPSIELIDMAVFSLLERADREHGGFGSAPKFPHPMVIDLCLRQFARAPSREIGQDAARVALLTLEKMSSGGLFDQLGGGFFRYSTDLTWTIPHFEKMLSDNALLIPLYVDAWRITGDERHRSVVERTIDWLLREMALPGGLFASALDADSDGEEGAFYLWQAEEALAAVVPADRPFVAAHYGLDQPANFIETGREAWHLRCAMPLETIATRVADSMKAAAAPDTEALDTEAPAAAQAAVDLDLSGVIGPRLERARKRLLTVRDRRSPPHRDDKALTAWNALTIRALAHAARAFDRDDWARAARVGFDRIVSDMMPEGRLLASRPSGGARLDAYLDDHAFLLQAALELLEVQFDSALIGQARHIAGQLMDHFGDRPAGGFFFTRHDHEVLIHRPRQGFDAALPAGNAIAAQALERLALMVGDLHCHDAARATVAAFGEAIGEQPSAFAALLGALAEQHEPPTLVVLRGSAGALKPWQWQLARAYRPALIVLAIADAEPADALPAALAHPLPRRGVLAYVCRGTECLAPIDSLEALESALGEASIFSPMP